MKTNKNQQNNSHKVLIGSFQREYAAPEAFIGIVFAEGVNHRAKLDERIGVCALKAKDEDLSILSSDEAGSILRPMSVERRSMLPIATAALLEYGGWVKNVEVFDEVVTAEELVKIAGQKAVDQLISRFEPHHV